MIGRAPGEHRHGTYERYRKGGCRCAECKKANNLYLSAATRRRTSRRGGSKPDPLLPHGRENTYNKWGCRCEKCTAAANEANKARRARGVES